MRITGTDPRISRKYSRIPPEHCIIGSGYTYKEGFDENEQVPGGIHSRYWLQKRGERNTYLLPVLVTEKVTRMVSRKITSTWLEKRLQG